MTRELRNRFDALLLLLILFAAQAGQKVHIYTEDPLHVAAFCGDLLPDNGASSSEVEKCVVEKCVVDVFPFFCYEYAVSVAFAGSVVLVGTCPVAPVRAANPCGERPCSLRAPPARA